MKHSALLRITVLTGATVGLFLAGSRPAEAQCSLCRDAVASSSTETREAMNYAIIGLAFAPYGIAALGAFAASPRLRGYIRGRLVFTRRRVSGDPL